MTLYSDAHPWWSHADRDALLAALGRVRPKTVLEFGPGMSTLTLLEAGAWWIDTFEDNPAWYATNRRYFERFARIHPHLYRRRDPLHLPQVRTPRYDLAFVDGPRWVHERRPELRYAREHARAVVVHDFWYPAMRTLVASLFADATWRAEQFTTKPGEALALLTRR